MPIFHFLHGRRWCHAVLPALVSAGALAAPPSWVPLEAAVLDGARGGFTLAPALQVSLGIERMVAINGDLVAQSRLALMGGAGLPEAAAPILVQTGDGNLAQAALQNGLLIQNTLSGQHIDSSTVIHATVNSAAMLDAINFQAQLSDALARAAGPR